MTGVEFKHFFHQATRETPFPFQSAFASGESLPSLVKVPTGLGKTAMAVLGWLWRRRFAEDGIKRVTPRRLVYCLPMRVLVEQTRHNAHEWIDTLRKKDILKGKVPVHVLMGGEDEDDWDIHPERDAIIIGTQDMLLSRALNRGYAASRARWPMHFGLLNTDCLWVFDEIQLMGTGLATTAQLEAFRRQLVGEGGPKDNGCQSVWMSATLQPDWLKTVDFKDRIDDQGRIDGLEPLSLTDADHENAEVKKRWNASKPLSKSTNGMDDAAALAGEIRKTHKPGTRTIVVVNTVKRACALFDALHDASADGSTKKSRKKGKPASEVVVTNNASLPNLVLLHSRFRPADRKKRVDEALSDSQPPGGTIIVSTQVIEAGVDVSAMTLFTELAPWASLVQRFGRCNRRGEQNEHASVRWIDLPVKDAEAEELRFPYELADLRAAAEELKKLNDVGLGSLAAHRETLSEKAQATLFPYAHTHIIRRKDLIDLFDTTPDLAGNDIDIDRYVRDIEDTDVRVFWRAWDRPKGYEPPPDDKRWRRVGRDELCPAPVGELKTFAEKHKGSIWRWDQQEGKWVRPDNIYPGQVYLMHAEAGGYDESQGWGQQHRRKINPLGPPTAKQRDDDEYDDDGLSMTGAFEDIAMHTQKVCNEMTSITDVKHGLHLSTSDKHTLDMTARWHDWGKAHEKFQIKIDDGQALADKDADGNPQFRRKRDGQWEQWSGCRVIAKAPGKRWNQAGELVDEGFWPRGGKTKDGFRRHFRHELASALAVLQRPHDQFKSLSDDDLNLVAYLIAAHHGKVRLSIRSMPNEHRPRDNEGKLLSGCRFARGVWDGDPLPEINLGGGVTAPAVTLSLEPMELGLCEQEPFAGQPSWIDRMIRLRDTMGPFRLAYLEALLCAADWRASAKGGQA